MGWYPGSVTSRPPPQPDQREIWWQNSELQVHPQPDQWDIWWQNSELQGPPPPHPARSVGPPPTQPDQWDIWWQNSELQGPPLLTDKLKT